MKPSNLNPFRYLGLVLGFCLLTHTPSASAFPDGTYWTTTSDFLALLYPNISSSDWHYTGNRQGVVYYNAANTVSYVLVDTDSNGSLDACVDGFTQWLYTMPYYEDGGYVGEKYCFYWTGPDPSSDNDLDTVPLATEATLGLNPSSADTDGDQMPDGWDADPFDPNVQ